MRLWPPLTLLLLSGGVAWAAETKTPVSNNAPAEPAQIVLEDFEKGFNWEGGNKKGELRDYNLSLEKGSTTNHLLRATYIAGTDGKLMYKKISWDAFKFPYLSWRWKVEQMPTGAKLHVDGKSDAAAQIYVGWKIRGRVYTLKYFWADSDPIDMNFRVGSWNPFGTYLGRVIRSGGALNQWKVEKRNVWEDFKKAFGKEPTHEANALGVLTDGDGTKTLPVAEYDDFVASDK